MASTRMPSSLCECGKELSAAADPDDRAPPPEPGNLSVCLYCGRLKTFGDDLRLRELTPAELDEVMRDPEAAAEIFRMREAIRKANASPRAP